MCEPASFVVTADNVYWSRLSEGHDDCIEEHHLRESVAGKPALVRVEVKPRRNDFRSPCADWTYRVEQDRLPDWYDAEAVERRVRAALPAWLAAKVVLPGESRGACNSYLVAVYGELESVHRGGIVEAVGCGGRVGDVYGGLVQSVTRGGRVDAVYDGGRVESVHRGGRVASVHRGGRVESVHRGGRVESVHRGGLVEAVCGGGLVEGVYEGGAVRLVYGVVRAVHSGGAVLAVASRGSVQTVSRGGTVQTDVPLPDIQLCGPHAVLIDRSGKTPIFWTG